MNVILLGLGLGSSTRIGLDLHIFHNIFFYYYLTQYFLSETVLKICASLALDPFFQEEGITKRQKMEIYLQFRRKTP